MQTFVYSVMLTPHAESAHEHALFLRPSVRHSRLAVLSLSRRRVENESRASVIAATRETTPYVLSQRVAAT